MLSRITRDKQVTIPKEFMEQLHLREGDYVDIECEGDSIHLRAVVAQDLNHADYEKLAAKLDALRSEAGEHFEDSASARKHLKAMMR